MGSRAIDRLTLPLDARAEVRVSQTGRHHEVHPGAEDEGIQYKTMVEETKRRDAVRLLDDQVMEIQQVATLLGYQDPANFTRAFRQWTGQTPSQYRATRHASR